MAAMSPLRRRMIEDITVRNLSRSTQQSYLYAVAKFIRQLREHLRLLCFSNTSTGVGREQMADNRFGAIVRTNVLLKEIGRAPRRRRLPRLLQQNLGHPRDAQPGSV
jgi:hypothetical protein